MLERSDKSWPVHSLASIPMLNNLNPLTLECDDPMTHSEKSPRVLDFLTFEVACLAMRSARLNSGLQNRFRILLHRTLVTEIWNKKSCQITTSRKIWNCIISISSKGFWTEDCVSVKFNFLYIIYELARSKTYKCIVIKIHLIWI